MRSWAFPQAIEEHVDTYITYLPWRSTSRLRKDTCSSLAASPGGLCRETKGPADMRPGWETERQIGMGRGGKGGGEKRKEGCKEKATAYIIRPVDGRLHNLATP